MRLASSAVVVAVLLAAASTAHAAQTLADVGRTGAGKVREPARCIDHFGPGIRYISPEMDPPLVRGINFRRGRKDYSRVRYKVWLMDWTSFQVLSETRWSRLIRVSDRRARTWSGVTAFQANHTGAYTLDVRVEWFKNGRRRGWWAYRLDDWHFWDVYNQGPFGPYQGCASNSQFLFPRPLH
jgi:hypothetical protein